MCDHNTKIGVTGANGFVGRHLCHHLRGAGYSVVAITRQTPDCYDEFVDKGIEVRCVNAINGSTDWAEALEGISILIHSAAVAHDTRGSKTDQYYYEVNFQGTERLITKAVELGELQHFVFISSAKVHGDYSIRKKPIAVGDAVNPIGPYGISKYLAEEAIKEKLRGSTIKYTILRPPVIYGPGVRANFLSLVRFVKLRLPLQVISMNNKRSILSIWNLSYLIEQIIKNERSYNKTYLVSDGIDLSIAELIRIMSRAENRRKIFLPLPNSILYLVFLVLRRRTQFEKLAAPFEIESRQIFEDLNWYPTESQYDHIARTMRAVD